MLRISLKKAKDLDNFKYSKNCFEQKISEHVVKNQIYPKEALDLGIQGRIIVYFVIDENGEITDIKTSKKKGNKILEKEAIRIISLLPKMTSPGYANGKPVKVKYMQPITFIFN